MTSNAAIQLEGLTCRVGRPHLLLWIWIWIWIWIWTWRELAVGRAAYRPWAAGMVRWSGGLN